MDRWWACGLALLAAAAGCLTAEDGPERDERPLGNGTALLEVAGGFERPLLLTHAGDGSGDLYVVEQTGKVWRLPDEGGREVFLDLSGRVEAAGWEQGLLGLAFHPGFAANGVVVASYTEAGSEDSVLERFRLAPNASMLDPDSGEALLRVAQPFENHNGGHVAYGPDGYLYLGLGDGGLAADPHGNGQNRLSLLGSLLRLDVGAEGPASAPPDNPFVGDASGADEVWAYGLRNPWRFSFDRATGDLWIADVGQNAWEEVNLQRAGGTGGENYGWSLFEGSPHFPSGVAPPAPPPGFVFPVAEYPIAGEPECSVTGGHVYRGAGVPHLEGLYLFGDYCSGAVWTLAEDAGWRMEGLLETGLRISSFGEDEAGEVYVVDHDGGGVHRFVAS